MSEDHNKPATIGEVVRIVTESEHRLVEAMRTFQTELLRGFQSFNTGQTIRIRKVEADQSNLDTALSGRLQAVEDRLFEIELKLGGVN